MAFDNNIVANYGITLGFLSAIITSVVKQFFDARAAAKRWERDRLDRAQQHQWDREARLEAARSVESRVEMGTALMREHDAWERGERAEAQAQAQLVADRLAESKDLILQAIDRAAEAYREANGINEKLLRLGLSQEGEGASSEAKSG